MGEQRQMRTLSRNRMQNKRCSANGIIDEFIVVDDDEVIILDYPESSKGKAPSTSRTGNEFFLRKVISIDDDDDDDDTKNVDKAGTSSIRNSLAANLQTSTEVDNDDCQFVQEKCAAFRFSKCKQTFSTGPSSGIRFGLGSDSGSDFSDESECSDCEILEGSHREVREQWEKAFLRKMKKAAKADLSEEVGPSELHCDTNFGPGFEPRAKQHDRTSPFFPARNPDRGKETSPTFIRTDDRIPNSPLFGSQMEEDNRAKQNFANSRAFNKEDFAGPSSLSPEIQVEHERSKEPIHQNGFKDVEKQPDRVQVERETPKLPKENQKKKAAYQSYTKKVEKEEEEDASKSSSPQTFDKDGDIRGAQSNGARCDHGISSTSESREPMIDPIPSTSEQVQGIRVTAPAMDIMFNKEMLKETDEYKKAQEAERESRQRQLQIQAEEAQRLRKRRKQLEMERRQKERVEEVRETQNKDIMFNKEKMKETDEYKKAQEEEWESRQRQLKIQAEEAQRQRKRRKLETTRQLEVVRRQKERVEEVRETQKKDEESMNMKEQVRAEITKSLKLLELKSINMASLLRGLGIHVGGGTSPMPQEVHAAYKRAVLKFHPDRASRGDIRQQVESEEKFKLIARMKDKFLS